jgi:signal peptidase I
MATLRSWASHAALALLIVAFCALVAAAVGAATEHRVLIVRSGSMAPAIAAGDAVVVRADRPAQVQVSDVVTFQDPSRSGRLLTHRVRRIEARPGAFAFVTQGDANTGVERWSMPAGDTLGTVVLRLPKLGYALVWLRTLRVGLVMVAALLLGSVALQRIWAQ